ncbi:SMC-Scp complex subunit ScpB [Candidatus Sumerlaeota bacterium]|nr:SMC-Scp complex subunit ScpB [Candidatus Sumerlaeota bacterium]
MTEKTSEETPPTEAPDIPEEAITPVDDVVQERESDLPRVGSATEAKAILEALLFTSNASLSVSRLASLLPGWSKRQVLDMLIELRDELDESARGVMIHEVAGGWIMATRPRHADWVYSLHRTRRRNPLSPQALETLAIIAYRQPITRADVEVIRGVDAGGVLRNLLDLGLIEVTGHRETLGRPPLYGTTQTFLRTFGLKTLGDLPSIEELRVLLTTANRAAESAQDEAQGEETSPDAGDGEDQPEEIEDTLEDDELREIDGARAEVDEEDFEDDEDDSGDEDDDELSR